LSALIVMIGLLVGAYALAVVEGWASTGRLQPARPLLGGLALLARSSPSPGRHDAALYEAAPLLVAIAGVSAAAVLPLADGLVAVDLATGALFVNASWVYVLIALVMAGWGSGTPFAVIGGWRFLGQVVAYAMLIVMPITAVAMRAASLSTVAIVRSQEPVWNALYQPLGFVLFGLAAMAVAFVPPFDLPVAPGELAMGVMGHYGGSREAIFRAGRLVLVISLALAMSVFYLGGWLGPVLPGWVWSSLKVAGVTAVMLIVGRWVPRLRLDDVLPWAWKLGIPLALANIAWTGVTLLAVPR
jgi:NADH-quinone oxidoreductase subunit H